MWSLHRAEPFLSYTRSLLTTQHISYSILGYFLSFAHASTLLPSSGKLCSFTHHRRPWHQGLASGEHLEQHRWSGRIFYLGNIDVTKWHCVTNLVFCVAKQDTALLWSQWSFLQLLEWFPSLTFFLREAGYEELPKVGFHHPSITVLLAHIRCYSPRNSPCICECIARALLQRLWLALPSQLRGPYMCSEHCYYVLMGLRHIITMHMVFPHRSKDVHLKHVKLYLGKIKFDMLHGKRFTVFKAGQAVSDKLYWH